MRTMVGAFLVFLGVNVAVYAFPLLPDGVPVFVRWAFVDLGLFLTVVGMTVIARAKRAT